MRTVNELPRVVLEAEQATLGSMLIEKEATRSALDLLVPADFYCVDHQLLFAAATRVYARDGVVDVVTLAEHLRMAEQLDRLGAELTETGELGGAYLFFIVNRVVVAKHVEHYAKLVKEASLDRAFSAQLAVTYQQRTPENVRQLHELMNALHGVHHRPPFDFRKDLHAYLEEILDAKTAETIDTGFSALDRHLGGLDVGDVTVVGARTSGGKTAWMTKACVQVAQQFADKNKKDANVLYYTTEMTEQQIVSRVMPLAASVEAWKFRRRKFSPEDITRLLAAAADHLSKLPMLVQNHSHPSLSDLSAAIARCRPRVVFVDYLQRCRFEGRDSRAYQIMDFMVGLKTLAQQHQINIVIGCQLDRKLDKTLPEPENADLKDSGAIEAEADQVVLLWKPSQKDLAKDPETPPVPVGHHLIRAKVSKNRHGSAWGRSDFLLNWALVDLAEHIAEQSAAPERTQKKENDLWSR